MTRKTRLVDTPHPVPAERIRVLSPNYIAVNGDYVLYWMIAFRRTRFNFALQRAVELAVRLQKPLLVFEALRVDYPWANDRLHRFIIEGMADNKRALEDCTVTYYPFIERCPKESKGLLEALSEHACIIITDDYPCFFLPNMTKAASRFLRVCLELVDSNGILPIRSSDKLYVRAVDFRRFVQKHVLDRFPEFPRPDPLQGVVLPSMPALPQSVLSRWPPMDPNAWLKNSTAFSNLPIDHSVTPVPLRGGSTEGRRVLTTFVEQKLQRYALERNHPDENVASGLSPYLHFGHISSHEVFEALAAQNEWTREQIHAYVHGRPRGWWGMEENSELFLDQLITWRELGFHFCVHRPDYDQFESLPPWALKTLSRHACDQRPYLYRLDQFEQAKTHDPLWNAAQRQLLREGAIHNYLRMLWGKKILEWSETPEQALSIMIHLNNKYALDGRDPNSYTGIFWVLGRFDRPWAPERPIFGRVRYMSSTAAMRKLRVKKYLEKYS